MLRGRRFASPLDCSISSPLSPLRRDSVSLHDGVILAFFCVPARAPLGQGILWNIPPTVTTLAANVDRSTATPTTPAGSQQCGKGTDAATGDGYYGPGAPCNVYEFVVYALSISQFLPSNATDQEAVRTQLQELGSSILATASLRGRTDQGC
jgi:hypothetical protein